ncbi:MAG TPA: c-type cytochrome [Chitinophagaceae bacterium]|mgnify:FL=1|jgi:mono/diheme cytochrome c family protein|nr:c-type cytochrome [Chitinophagaceae bacterium]
MKKNFAAATILIFVCTVAYITSCQNKNQKKPENQVSKEDSTKNLIARGDYLANHVTVCIDCHSIRDTGRFSMPIVPGTEGGGAGFPFTKTEFIPGVVMPPNITPAALKDWSDEDLIKVITRGINKKGDTLFPIMPYHAYSTLAKSDVLAIVAYIRTLKPVEHQTMPRKLEIPMSDLGPLPDGNLDNNKMPDPSDKVAYGSYLTTVAACANCHTPRGPQGFDFSKMFSGGTLFDNPVFKVAVANITPDSATGIGNWTEEMFVEKFKENASDKMLNTRPGRDNTFMPWSMYGKMKDEDLKAIYAFLRTVKPIQNRVVKHPN